MSWDALCVDAAGTLTACGGGSPIAYLSEIRFDETTTGGATNEYVEIAAPPGTSLDTLALLVIGDGSSTTKSGVIECLVPLTGAVVGESGYFLITLLTTGTSGQDGIAFGVPGDLQVSNLQLENSDNLTVMLVDVLTGTLNQDLDTNDDGTLDVTPWTSIVDKVSIVKTFLPAPTGSNEWWYGCRVGPNASGLAYQIYRCSPIGYWQTGNRVITDPLTLTDTPGAQNLDCPGGIVNLCPTDLNGDSVTDSSDMGSLLGSFGTCEPGTPGDFNGDLVIDSSDLGSMLGNFGPCPTE